MTPLTQQTTLGQLVSMVFAIALLLGTVAGLSAVAGDDEAALREPPEAGQAQSPAANAEQRTAAATLSADDRSFIDTALKGGIAEVKEVALAQKKAGDPQIRQAAAHLEKDHKALNAELERIGAQYGVALPSEPSPERKTLYQKLEKLSGEQFDVQFLKAATEAHKKGIALFERTRSNSANAEIKSLASETLPTLKKHLTMLEELQGRKKVAPSS